MDAVRQLLTATRRDWYEIKVIDVPQAAIALHARAVILISAPAVALVNAAELQAAAAHEIGHEYVWTEWNRAHQHRDRERLKELELACDAIAAVTLRQVGMDPSRMSDAMEKIARFNRQRFGMADNEDSYPILAERRARLFAGSSDGCRRRAIEPICAHTRSGSPVASARLAQGLTSLQASSSNRLGGGSGSTFERSDAAPGLPCS